MYITGKEWKEFIEKNGKCNILHELIDDNKSRVINFILTLLSDDIKMEFHLYKFETWSVRIRDLNIYSDITACDGGYIFKGGGLGEPIITFIENGGGGALDKLCSYFANCYRRMFIIDEKIEALDAYAGKNEEFIKISNLIESGDIELAIELHKIILNDIKCEEEKSINEYTPTPNAYYSDHYDGSRFYDSSSNNHILQSNKVPVFNSPVKGPVKSK